jgi:hypothetical protein
MQHHMEERQGELTDDDSPFTYHRKATKASLVSVEIAVALHRDVFGGDWNELRRRGDARLQ